MRDDMVFSDYSLIRMYDDSRLGVRLRGTWNRWAKKIEFNTGNTTEKTVRLPAWRPQAVKGWGGFEGISDTPENTVVEWRISDGVSDYWWNGAAWFIATLDTEWNTEIDISANIGEFPHVQKYIRFIARLTTNDRWETPILYGYRLLITASFDWFEDLIIRSLKHRLDEDFAFPINFSGIVDTDTDRFNVKTDDAFKPEQDWNITNIEAVYDDDNDPNHETNILQSFDSGSGVVRLNNVVLNGTRLDSIYEITPDVVINFPSSDYTEVGKTPVIILDNFSIRGRQVHASTSIALKDKDEGRKLEAPLWVDELTCNCTIYTGSTLDTARLFTQAYAFQIKGTTQRSNHKIGSILKTEALDLEHTIKITPESRYSPKPDISDLKESVFTITITNFYAWLRDIQNTYLVTNFNYTVNDMKNVGSSNFQVVKPLNAGVIAPLYKIPEIEET
jgi:hypothetical protein